MEIWHVYQFRSDTELLYVGYTRVLKPRLAAHRRQKPWWPEVTDIRLEQFATEDEARQREKEIWAAERPKYNKNSPFLTAEERATYNRENVAAWKAANAERVRNVARKYRLDPANREHIAAYQRAWKRRNQPTTVTGRRIGRWQQTGPSLFD